MMGLRCRHVFGQNSIRHTSCRGSQCSQCFQAAPRSTTLQDICESVCEKWLGLGVVMPSGHTIAPGKPFATAGDILLDLPTHPVRPEKLIPGSPNSHAVWALVPPPETSPLWQLSGDLQGTRISGGTFRLPDNAFLVLTDCSGISFQDVQFIGGTIVALHSGCSVQFQRCTFTGCTIVATGGAEVSTSDCTHEFTGIALFCSDHDTKVVVRGGIMRHCEQCACVANSALLEMHDVACSGACITAIEARGENSYLVMHGCSIKSSRHVPSRMQSCVSDPTGPAPGPPSSPGATNPSAAAPDSNCHSEVSIGNDAPDGRLGAGRGVRVTADPAGPGSGHASDRKQWAVCGVWGHSGARIELVRCVVRKMAWGLWLDGAVTRAEVAAFRASGMRRGSMLVLNGATLVRVPDEEDS